MKQIGIISDTHGYLDDKVFSYFAQCDEIWHAGDIGPNVAEKLASFKPFKAVHGNIDGADVRRAFPEELFFECEGQRVYMVHIGGSPGKYTGKVKAKIIEKKPSLFICGHSHILRVVTDKTHHNMLYLNPGAAGIQGFHTVRTLVRLKIHQGIISDLQVIELGNRNG
jgi:putative phosphoesterase